VIRIKTLKEAEVSPAAIARELKVAKSSVYQALTQVMV
jgi:hypothetical protein